ncbi:MAG: glycerate kinase [Actinomycetaceae bacterium]
MATDRVGALPAVEVAAALGAGWRTERDDDLRSLPMSDGSGGVLAVLADASREVHLVPGPLGGTVPATIARRAGTAWIDADEVLGAHVVPGRIGEALSAGSSTGLGVLVARAVREGATRVVVGMTAAVVHDAGAGLVTALAEAAHGRGDRAPDDDPQAWPERFAAARGLLTDVDVVVARAVDDPLTGLHGAGAMLTERFGVDPADAQRHDRRAGSLAAEILGARRASDLARPAVTPLPVLGGGIGARAGGGAPSGAHSHGDEPARLDPSRTPGGGAGGGAALALAALGARLFDGADVVAAELGLDGALDVLGQDGVVVTSATEVGSDEARSSVMSGVGRRAAERALPVVAVGRTVTASRRELAPSGISASAALVPGRLPDEEPAAADPAALGRALEDRGARLARTWSRR